MSDQWQDDDDKIIAQVKDDDDDAPDDWEAALEKVCSSIRFLSFNLLPWILSA